MQVLPHKGQDDTILELGRKRLQQGGVVAYPTETFYGLAVNPLKDESLQALDKLKGRRDKPYPILIGSIDYLQELGVTLTASAHKLTKLFWPGPLTLVLRSNRLDLPCVGSDEFVGVRISANILARRFIDYLGHPITSTSANPSDQPPATSTDQVQDYFGDKVFCLDGGKTAGQTASTVVRVTDRLELLRQGAIDFAAIQRVAGVA